MAQDTTARCATAQTFPPLLQELWLLLAAHRPAVRQTRVFDRLRGLVVGQLCTLLRHTVSQALVALGLVDTDPGAFYRLLGRGRVDYAVLTQCFLGETLAHIPASGPYVAVVDGVQIPRSSRTMPGTGWLPCPRTPCFARGSHRAQFFGHLAALLPGWQGYSRALPLRLDPAFSAKAVPGAAPSRSEAQTAREQVSWLRRELDAAGRAAQPLLVLGDAHFDTIANWRDLPARTVLLARTACNRTLFTLPPPGARKNRRYGDRAPRPDAWVGAKEHWQFTTVPVRGRAVPLRYRVEGPFVRRGAADRPLWLVVVSGSRKATGRYRRRRTAGYFLVNAVQDAAGAWTLPLPIAELLAWTWQRWEVEVCHREMKSGFGVGQMQCWSAHSTVPAVQLQAWTYAICVLAGYRAWGYDRHPRLTRTLWWAGAARWSLATLWRGYQQAFARAAAPHPRRAAPRGTWPEGESWLHHLDALLDHALAA
jgi:hypothetical protein